MILSMIHLDVVGDYLILVLLRFFDSLYKLVILSSIEHFTSTRFIYMQSRPGVHCTLCVSMPILTQFAWYQIIIYAHLRALCAFPTAERQSHARQ